MAKAQDSMVKRSLFSWIMGPNTKLQLLVLVVIAVTVFARVLPLEMQKRIVNEAIRLLRRTVGTLESVENRSKLYLIAGEILARTVERVDSMEADTTDIDGLAVSLNITVV